MIFAITLCLSPCETEHEPTAVVRQTHNDWTNIFVSSAPRLVVLDSTAKSAIFLASLTRSYGDDVSDSFACILATIDTR